MNSITIAVPAPSGSYNVEIGAGLLASVGPRIDALLRIAHGSKAGLDSGRQRVFVITSPEIWRLHGDALTAGLPSHPDVLSVPPGEPHKRLSTVETLLEALVQKGADRDSILIALGGGIIGDVTGFVAAVYMRGIRYIGVPTTALAQIDSSVGGKTGVNLASGKNLAGAFHHPLAVYSDISTLSTLPAEELRAGLQEAVKSGIIRDRILFDFLDVNSAAVLSGDAAALTAVVSASVRVKAEIVGLDEKESGLRMILNLGHTLGHAIEAATGYQQLLHGEAVAWGMMAAIHIAAQRDLVSAAEAERMQRVISDYGPLQPFTADAEVLVALTARDKKNRSGARPFVLPVGIGNATVVRDVSEAELLGAATVMLSRVTSLRAFA